MKPSQKPNLKSDKSASVDKRICVNLSVVSDKERQSLRIPTYAYILP